MALRIMPWPALPSFGDAPTTALLAGGSKGPSQAAPPRSVMSCSVGGRSAGRVSVGRRRKTLDGGPFAGFTLAGNRQPLLEPFLHRCDDRPVHVNEKQRIEHRHQPPQGEGRGFGLGGEP